MKTTILIEDGDVKVTFTPESEVERLAISELGDDIGISHSHKSLVLRRRRADVRKIADLTGLESVEPVDSAEG